MKNKLFLAVCALVIATGIFYYNKTDKVLQNNTTLTIGTVAGYAPFVSINPQGDYEGFDIDMANAIAKTLGKELVIKDLGSMASLFTALEQGSIDAIIWAMSITESRLQKVAMIHYQGKPTTSYPLIFWETLPAGVTSISDMQGKTICVEPASSQEAVLRNYSDVNVLPTERVDDALLHIQYRKADAALVEPAIAKKFKAKYPTLQVLEVPLPPSQCEQGIGIVIKKDNAPLIKAMTDAVRTLKEDGTVERIEQTWGIAE